MKKILALLSLITTIAYSQPSYIQLKAIQPAVGNGSFLTTATNGTLVGSPTYTPTIPNSKITGQAATSPLFLTSGTWSIQPAGTSQAGALSSVDWNTFNNKEPAITSGTTLQYWRGDKTFQTLNTSIVPELTNLYFTEPRVRSTVLPGFNSSITWNRISTSTNVQDGFSLLQRQSNYLQSTRFISGAGVTINADPTKFNIQVEGEIVDPNTFVPTAISVSLTAQTVTYLATQVESYVWINSSGTVVQSLTPPLATDFDAIVGYWVLVHSNLTNINVVNSFPYYTDGAAIKVAQILDFIGFSKYPGTNIASAGTTGTRLTHTGGFAIKLGLGNTTKRPVSTLVGATDPATMEMRHRNGVNTTGVQNIDVTNYNPSGSTVSALSNNKYAAHKIWKFASGLIRIQYGETQYDNYNDAISRLDIDTYVDEGNASRNGLFIGWLVFKKGTSWGSGGTGVDGVDYKFVDVRDGKSSGGFTPSLQAGYDVSTQPQIKTTDTKGAVQIQSAMAQNTTAIVQGLNIAGTTTYSLTGNGDVTSNSITTNTINATTIVSPTLTGTPKTPTVAANSNNTTIINAAYVDIKTPFVTPEQYGAVGDGSTNDLTALQNAVNSGYKILLGNKTYKIAGTLSVTANTHLEGQGYISTISSTTNTYVINVTGAHNTFKNFRILGGAADAGSGGIQNGISALGNAGFTAYQIENIITGCYFENLKIGVASQSVIGTSSGANHEGAFTISDCVFNDCNVGFYALVRGEYNTLANCKFFSCTYGIAVNGGNNNVVGGQVTDCDNGIFFVSGSNDAHCGASGVKFNHNTVNVSGTHTLDWTFSNCWFYAGGVNLSSAGKTIFNGCEFSLSSQTLTVNSSPAYFNNCNFVAIPGTYTLTGTAPIMSNCFNGTSKLYTPLLAYSEITAATLDFASTAAGAVSDLTVTVTGAVLNDAVDVGVPNGSVTATANYYGWVSSAGVVTIRFSPKATEDPASGSFKVFLHK